MRRDRRHAGIDVSHWEGKIDFRRVREAGIRIVYIKATQGHDIVDEEFERNYRDAHREGLRVGFYHYVTARSAEEAKRQADFFCDKIQDKEQRVKPAMDFEVFGALTQSEVRNISLQFLGLPIMDCTVWCITSGYGESMEALERLAVYRQRTRQGSERYSGQRLLPRRDNDCMRSSREWQKECISAVLFCCKNGEKVI